MDEKELFKNLENSAAMSSLIAMEFDKFAKEKKVNAEILLLTIRNLCSEVSRLCLCVERLKNKTSTLHNRFSLN